MSLQSQGLTDVGSGPGLTENFKVQYESSLYDSLPAAQAAVVKANLIANSNYLLSVVEGAFTTTIGWFGTPSSNFGTGNRQQVNLNKPDGSGASNNGYGHPINLDGQGNNATVSNAGPIVAMVWMNEWSEILMSLSGGQWNSLDSSGEGLSQYTGIELFQSGHYSYYGSWVEQWLNGVSGSPNAKRSDWVTQTFTGSGAVHGDGDSVSFGCALGFIYYLNAQLAFSINQIIAAYAANMAGAYSGLTGDSSDPFPRFLDLLAGVYPASATASIPGPVSDNPFPIAQVSFWAQKDTFGKDETQDIINTQGGLVPSAFSLAVEGFSKHSFQALGITVGAFSGTFFGLQGVAISPSPLGPQFESGVNDLTPQRILIPFDITLTSPILHHFPGSATAPYSLSVSLNAGSAAVSGSQASTQFELIAGADPYFANLNSSQSNLAYLSQDLRVFTATPAINDIPIPGGPVLADSSSGAFTYIQNLLTHLNSSSGFTNPNGVDPFTTIFPEQGGANSADSSVSPVTVDLSQGIFNPRFDNNYSFAIARVRLRGSSGTAGQASNVRVFFRLWATQTNDTDYEPNSTYRFTADSAGKPGSPLVGSGNTTIPFFATNNLASQTDYAAGGPNIQTLRIPNHEDSLWWYFGCFLNLYDPANVINGAQVQTVLAGTHHCLVAQIAFDGAPIPTGVSPLAWDQLAQRNLQITLSDNPGPAATHRVPQTFDCRPSKAVSAPGAGRAVYPDELMIDWGDVPSHSVASLYWPQVLASDVIALADQFYSTNPLSAADLHTIKIPVTRDCVSYVPIPAGTGENFAGLFTIDLPTSVRSGQQYDIVVRRISTHAITEPTPPPPIRAGSPPSTVGRAAKRTKSARALAVVEPTRAPISWG
jgi:hypothetical protein